MYYDSNDVVVDTTSFIAKGITYPLNDISSVSGDTIVHKDKHYGSWVLVTFFSVLSIYFIYLMYLEPSGTLVIFIPFFAYLAKLMIPKVETLKDEYVVRITTPTGQVESLTSNNQAEVQAIVIAINQAISM